MRPAFPRNCYMRFTGYDNAAVVLAHEIRESLGEQTQQLTGEVERDGNHASTP